MPPVSLLIKPASSNCSLRANTVFIILLLRTDRPMSGSPAKNRGKKHSLTYERHAYLLEALFDRWYTDICRGNDKHKII